ncbi:ZIP family metal transporter [Azospira inquinata]|uniref:ZIP family metal transporter n=1 Tax=Azospira inquinata TaxID=2785627 RepID=A0A975SMT2_9RHOO|nr:ZIP family metal transporter [Azospira inquinata]QWT45433.1 ZIP family metal transporter [Azospira inquinata]QWT49239.1 ZIP family metal transporter [Azospira inquinata]
MSTLAWIICMTLLGGSLSVMAASGVTYVLGLASVQHLISYAIGALLGAVFLEILPHALEHGSPDMVALTLLAGILLFFILEKLVLWRHCHSDHCEAHEARPAAHDHGRSGLMILVGDTFHNFVDGILIAAAFMEDTHLGIVTGLAIITHEIPQEVGDFMVLLHSGYSRWKALVFNLVSCVATLFGGLFAYFALKALEEWVPALLGLAAASMLYVSVADLIPGLHKRTELRATAQQVALILLGVASIWGAKAALGE